MLFLSKLQKEFIWRKIIQKHQKLEIQELRISGLFPINPFKKLEIQEVRMLLLFLMKF